MMRGHHAGALEYRPEVDGLRALAVIGVIITHFNSHLLPGGFLGVDMFFVISGYVITGSLYKSSSVSLGDFLLDFYKRRVKRLIPALVLCVLVTSVLLTLFNPNPGTSLKTGVAALFGVSNLYLFFQATDYFGASAQLNAFTHTWSLGVEEQFYLIFPLLLWLAGIGGREAPRRLNAIILLSVLALISLWIFISLHASNPPAAYYLTPARFWELSAGALLFLALRPRQAQQRRLSNALSEALSIIALAGIAITFLVPVEASVYSTPAIVLFTMLLIASLQPKTVSFAVFAHPVTVHIGLLSYSLYLWHWAVISLSRWTIGIEWWTFPFQLALIVLLAEVSYRYVENPLRRAEWSPSRLRTMGFGVSSLVGAALVVVMLGSVLNERLYAGTHPELAAVGNRSLMDPYVMQDTHSGWGGEPCLIESNADIGKDISLEACTLGRFDTAQRRVLVIGNSHAAAFVQAFDPLVREEGYAVTITAAWAAPAVPEIPHVGLREKAIDYYWEEVVPTLVDQLQEDDWVFLITDLNRLTPRSPSSAAQDRLQQLEAGLTRLSETLASRGIKFAVLHGKPFAREAMCEPIMAASQWFAPFGGPCTYFSKEDTLKRLTPLNDLLRGLEMRNGIKVVDLLEVFCPDEVCTYFGANGEMLYRDDMGHASVEAARLAAPAIRDLFLAADQADVVARRGQTHGPGAVPTTASLPAVPDRPGR
ncbi:acyltransferase [Thiocapsa imhoffii]|uniref:Acyltransferase n=1 Tax=Thiocapsa imhoffii TaxID=382777 RepID=A0A9X1B7T1_9GAMM|nr:acyltransferase family protein [Thiocapsa imhoffii]MBK1643236.1 acyltransferase [Thiocapsa imhoffii]